MRIRSTKRGISYANYTEQDKTQFGLSNGRPRWSSMHFLRWYYWYALQSGHPTLSSTDREFQLSLLASLDAELARLGHPTSSFATRMALLVPPRRAHYTPSFSLSNRRQLATQIPRVQIAPTLCVLRSFRLVLLRLSLVIIGIPLYDQRLLAPFSW